MATTVSRQPIAIIGIGCRFPGGVSGPDAFWQLLMNGIDAVGDVPADRWDPEEYYHPDRARPGKVYTRCGGFLEQVDRFDAEFFGISPREAARIDPQHRLLLEVAWEALEDGGLVAERLTGSRTGVFVGICTDEYGELQFKEVACINPYTNIGGSPSIAANRLSYTFDFRGPSVAVDTACSSSLVAVHLACQSLWNGESTLALAGGVHVMLGVERSIGFGKASMLSPTGRCWSFDARGDGYVRGEGAGVIVLKPLAQAIADGDPIYAQIVASGVNSDGRTTGLSLPNVDAQIALLREVYARADIAPGAVQYVEAHGTGTPAGDPIECTAIGTVLGSGAGRNGGDTLRIGSVKTNIGHLEAASGIAGLIKVALSVKKRSLPASRNFERPNPKIDLAALGLQVQQTTAAWPACGERPVAGVASFGFGGTNAHVVLTGAGAATVESSSSVDLANAVLVPMSARTPDALKALSTAYRTRLLIDGDVSIADVAYTASTRRSHHEHRAAVVASSSAELIEGLDALIAGEPRRGVAIGRANSGKRPRVAFVCSGNGPQWWGMGRRLLEEEPVFRASVERCDRLLREYADWSLMAELQADQPASRMHLTSIAQPALFAVQAGLLSLWRSWGITPDAVFGHSVGEVAAAFAAGVLDLDTAIKVIFHRSRTQELTAGAGKMAAVELTEGEARAAIDPYGGRVVIAAVNAPSAVTLSGDNDAIDALMEELTARQIFCRQLRLNYAFHSHHMDPVREDLLTSLEGIQPRTATVPFVSGVTGLPIAGTECDATYWWDNIRKPVLFSDAASGLVNDGFDLFVEVGPHPVLATYVPECASRHKRSAVVLPSLRRDQDDRTTLLSSVGSLYAAGYSLDWKGISRSGRLTQLPSYPWQRERHWYSTSSARSTARRRPHPLLGTRVEAPSPQWRSRIDRQLLPYLDGHQIQGSVVFPAAGFIEMAFAAAADLFGEASSTLNELEIRQALILDSAPATVHVDVSQDFGFTVNSREEGSEQEWRTHVTGRLARSAHPDESPRLPIADIRVRCATPLTKEQVYAETDRMNHQYRGAFQGIKAAWLGDSESFGEITAPAGVERELGEYRLHPAILDACIQLILPILPTWGTGDTSPWLPVSLGRITWRARPTRTVYAHARRVKYGANWLSVDCLVADADGNVIVEMRDFRIRQLQARRGTDRDGAGRQYTTVWQFQSLAPTAAAIREADYLPSPQEVARAVEGQADGARDFDVQLRDTGFEQKLEALCAAYISDAFRELGLILQPHERLSIDTLHQRIGAPPHVRARLSPLLEILAEAGVLERRSVDEWEVTGSLPMSDSAATWRTLAASHPGWHAELLLVERCGTRLAEYLSGVSDPAEIIFSDKSGTAEHFFDGAPSRRAGNLLLKSAISALAEKLPRGRVLRVLELAGGTGGATVHVLPALQGVAAEYVFSDRSNAALGRAEQRFRSYPFVDYRLLDIADDPPAQGFEPHSFDVIVAGDAFGTTADLRRGLVNIQQLLASEGTLLLLERSEAARWEHLVFGLLSTGQPDIEDAAAPSESPSLDVLAACGFESASQMKTAGDSRSGTTLTIARGARIEPFACSYPAPVESGGRWMVFADARGIGAGVAAELEKAGHDSILVFKASDYRQLDGGRIELDPASWDHMNQLIGDIRTDGRPLAGIIHCWSLDAPEFADADASFERAQDVTCLSVTNLFQAVRAGYFRTTPAMWLVTDGVHAHVDGGHPSLAQSPLWGLGRVLANENPDLRCTLVDLHVEKSNSVAADIAALTAELFAVDHEHEIRLTGRKRYVHRLMAAADTQTRRRRDLGDAETVRLTIDGIGVLDNLKVSAVSRHKPGPGQVEIEVHATGLNFKDVLQATGVIAGDALERGFAGGFSLGLECSGVVVSVGAGVQNLRVGDAVMGFGRHCFSGHVIADVALVVRKPARLSFEEAATIPVTFATADYAVRHVGRIQRGECILIHGAAGGVGLSAIQIAQAAGAEIFATAGTPEKREFLRALGVHHVLDSRTLAFADDVLELTRGEGVDLVLNSLAGDASARSVAILKPFGRFLEIGKRDLLENRRQGLRPFERCLSFHAIDLDQLLLRAPLTVQKLLQDTVEAVEAGTLNALPLRTFPVSQSENAFRCMQQSRHIGKIVVSMRDPDVHVPAAAPRRLSLRADGTYVVAGGVGGFGLATARWLVEKGARHVVLFSRSGAVKGDAAGTLEWMRQAGAHVMVAAADVASRDDVSALFERIETSMPPVCGVIHAAMVLDDGIVLHLDRQRFSNVTRPKILGAWNLHQATLSRPVDFFVLFSSFSSLVGSPGQGNYAAANAFLDTLAAYRRVSGLHALAVNWGALADVGYLTRHSAVADILAREGVAGLPVAKALDVLEDLIVRDVVQRGVMDVDWPKWAKRAGRIPSLLSKIIKPAQAQQTQDTASDFAGSLRALPPGERRQRIESRVRGHVASVLGTSAAKLDLEKPITLLGLDSLMAVELEIRIERDLGTHLSLMTLLQRHSVASLSLLLAERLSGDEQGAAATGVIAG